MIPPVVASERGRAQTVHVTAWTGLQDRVVARNFARRTIWKVRPQTVTARYSKQDEAWRYPE